MKSMVPGYLLGSLWYRDTYCEVYGTGVLIAKSMVPGYLLQSLWYRDTYFEVYGTGILIVKPMVPGVLIAKSMLPRYLF